MGKDFGNACSPLLYVPNIRIPIVKQLAALSPPPWAPGSAPLCTRHLCPVTRKRTRVVPRGVCWTLSVSQAVGPAGEGSLMPEGRGRGAKTQQASEGVLLQGRLRPTWLRRGVEAQQISVLPGGGRREGATCETSRTLLLLKSCDRRNRNKQATPVRNLVWIC